MDLIEKSQVLKPEMFHKHWWLDRSVASPKETVKELGFLSQILFGREERMLGKIER
jgi:hypothetical protein